MKKVGSANNKCLKDGRYRISTNPFNAGSLLIKWVFLLVLFVFVSCQKDEEEAPIDTPLIASRTEYKNNVLTDSVVFQYDAYRRQIKQSHIGYYSLLNYTDTTVLISDYDSQGLYAEEVYVLNANGVAESWSATPLVFLTDSASFEYNEEGYLIQKTEFFRSSGGKKISYFTIQQGNTTHIRIENTSTSNFDYKFLTGKKNTVGALNMGIHFRGLPDKNLTQFVTDDFGVKTYTYHYDTLGRVVQQSWNVGSDQYHRYFKYVQTPVSNQP